VLGVLERAKAGNPSGNPVVVTVPVGMQPDGRQSQLDLRRTSKAPLGRRVVSHFFSVGCRFESCRSAKPQVSALSAWICLLWWQSLSLGGCLESTLGAGFGSACDAWPLGEGRGPRRMVRLARLLHRRGRVLGGPAVRAACGGDQLVRTALPKENAGDWSACWPTG
jgi:hypothetical protein